MGADADADAGAGTEPGPETVVGPVGLGLKNVANEDCFILPSNPGSFGSYFEKGYFQVL